MKTDAKNSKKRRKQKGTQGDTKIRAEISKKRRRQSRTERLWATYEERLQALFSVAMALSKNVLRRAIPILEEATWGFPDCDMTLNDIGRFPAALLTAFETRWGPVRQGMPIPMPPPADMPAKPESIL